MELFFVYRTFLAVLESLSLTNAENVQAMADIMSCMWASFAYGHSPNGGDAVPPNCDKVRKAYETWPRFEQGRAYYSLNYHFLLDVRPKAKSIEADNVYPNDEYPSDRRCDMWKTVAYPWKDRSTIGANVSIV